MKKPDKPKISLDDELPLRGLLKCHCGNPLTGAPSRGKSGKYFYYYKCRFSGHNNISAIKAHNQLLGACELMSLSGEMVKEIKDKSEAVIDVEMVGNRKRIKEKKIELEKVQENLFAVEEKWIKSQISKDTYDRWYSSYNSNIITLNGAIERLSKDQNQAFQDLKKHLNMLTDMKYVYTGADTIKKREFIGLVFDNNLYYQDGIYRTPTMMRLFTHNALLMSEKQYLIYEKKRDNQSIIPLSGEGGNCITLKPS